MCGLVAASGPEGLVGGALPQDHGQVLAVQVGLDKPVVLVFSGRGHQPQVGLEHLHRAEPGQ